MNPAAGTRGPLLGAIILPSRLRRSGRDLTPDGWKNAMALPKVVIVGRPNVGKSSLFNWLAGRRIAIVDNMAGVTRDRVSTLVQLGTDVEPRFVELTDTGGIGMVDRDDLSEDVERQIDTAMNEAALILFVVDIRDGLMPLDQEVAQRLRYLKTPVILVMNKADHPDLDNRGAEFYKLGRGKPIAVSTQQNRNKKALLRCIDEMLPPNDATSPADAVMKIAAVGRPNTGKLTLINTLARAERMIVSERPGTTRDSVDVHFELDGLPFLAIDTAGVSARPRSARAWTSSRSTAPSVRSAAPTSSCSSSTPPRASAGWTSNWPTTSPSSRSPASSRSTSGT